MNADTRPMTLGDWMLTLLVLAIPLVNVFMYLYWAITDSGNVNRKTFCQASILWVLILFGFFLAMGILFGGMGMILSQLG